MKVFTSKEFINKLNWLVTSVPNSYHSENGTWCTLHDGKVWLDCVCSIKGLLWGFKDNYSINNRGGAVYLSNGVADFGANDGIKYCEYVSRDFSNLTPGEYLCMKGTKYSHAGIYLGNGNVFECTTGWGARKCIISQIDQYGNRYYNGVKSVSWTYHGKLQYIDYSDSGDSYSERVKELQRVLNEQYGCGLAVDGSFGPLTTQACMKHYLYYLKKAPLHVKWLQRRLIAKGYSVGNSGADGSFGPATKRAVLNFQRNSGLVQDGYVGAETSKKLVQ